MTPGVELSDLNGMWLAIVLAMVFNFFLGFVWYAKFTPMGRLWMTEMKLDPDVKPAPGVMMRGMVLMIVGSFLTFFVLAHITVAYHDSYMLDEPAYKLTLMDGVMAGACIWLGFFVPLLWGGVAWEGKSWKLFFVNAGYHLIALVVGGILLVSL